MFGERGYYWNSLENDFNYRPIQDTSYIKFLIGIGLIAFILWAMII